MQTFSGYRIPSDRQFPSNLDFFVKVMIEMKYLMYKRINSRRLNIGGEMAVLRLGRK